MAHSIKGLISSDAFLIASPKVSLKFFVANLYPSFPGMIFRIQSLAVSSRYCCKRSIFADSGRICADISNTSIHSLKFDAPGLNFPCFNSARLKKSLFPCCRSCPFLISSSNDCTSVGSPSFAFVF